MTKKDDAEAVGNAVLKTMSAVARESGGEKLTGHAKVLNDLLDEVVGLQQTVNVRIYRQGYGLNAGKEEYITSMTNTDPQSLRDGGIEPIIQGVCGGGDYRLSITAPGIQPKSIRVLIAGESLPMKNERDAKAGTLPPWGMPTMMPDGKLGYNMAMPGVAQYLGLSPQGTQQLQGQQSNLGEALMLAQIITQQRQGNSSGDDEEKKKMMEMISELKAQNARAEAEKARVESERRADAQIAELKAQMEKMAVPKEDTAMKLLALLPMITPTITSYFASRDQAAQMAAQAQRDSAQAQMTLMMTMFNSQGNSSKENIELLKTMMLQPKESETDRMRGIMDLAMSSMSTTMGLTQSMVNQMASMQPGERPPWMEVLMTVIENAATMGQMALESRGAKKAEEEGEGEQPKRLGRTEVRALQPVPQGDGSSDMLDAASAAAAAAQQQLNDPDANDVMLANEARVAGLGEEEVLPDFSAGAFKLVFEKISECDAEGNFIGDVREIAFRLWKHASSGDKQALIWVQNPEEYTIAVLDGLAQRGLILVTAERIHEVAAAMIDMYLHFTHGGTAQEYIEKHHLSLSLPRRLVVVPIIAKKEGEVIEENEAAAEESPPADKIVEEVPQPEPKEPAVATPSFGGAPPAREPT